MPLLGQDQPPSGDAPATDLNGSACNYQFQRVVPSGSLQAENGFLETSSRGQSVLDASETLVRFGAAKRTELRFTMPDYYKNLHTGARVCSGFGDFAVGVKEQLGRKPEGFDVSIILFLSFPTGANAVSSGGYDPGMQLPWSRALSAKWTTAGMLSVYWPTQGRTRNVTGEFMFLLDRLLTKPWDSFIEYAGDFPNVDGPRHLLHFGTALKLAKRHQLDFHVGVGLSSAAVDRLIGIGYSFRIQAFRRE